MRQLLSSNRVGSIHRLRSNQHNVHCRNQARGNMPFARTALSLIRRAYCAQITGTGHSRESAEKLIKCCPHFREGKFPYVNGDSPFSRSSGPARAHLRMAFQPHSTVSARVSGGQLCTEAPEVSWRHCIGKFHRAGATDKQLHPQSGRAKESEPRNGDQLYPVRTILPSQAEQKRASRGMAISYTLYVQF